MESLTPLHVHSELPVSNLDLYDGDAAVSLNSYYDICRQASDLLVTTSCFAVWKKGKSTNGFAKVIPAVPGVKSGRHQAVRVFFFDDNINLSSGRASGTAEARGICNLRDVSTGGYVDFSVGSNGFSCDSAYRHTLIHHSTQYRNVLVQANILDAMLHPEYFTEIIGKYARPGEKLIVYMDVNGTILWNDSIMDAGPDRILLGTMFNFTEVRPRVPFEAEWNSQPAVKVEKTQTLKQIIHDIAQGEARVTEEFSRQDCCERFLNRLHMSADFGWVGQDATFLPEEFFSVYKRYMDELRAQDREQGAAACGITSSWFRCLEKLRQGRHAIVINSFGMDTHRVVLRSAKDPRRVPHVAINFWLWSERDTSKFKAQFEAEALPPPLIVPRFPGCGADCAHTPTAAGFSERKNGGTGFCSDGGVDALERFMGQGEPDYIFEFVVRKPSPDITLGAKVTHLQRGLEIAQLFSEGAIEHANCTNRTTVPRGETLRLGDVIQKVNHIEGDTKAMVEECKRSVNITFVVARPPRLMNQLGICGLPPVDPFDEEVVSPTFSRRAGVNSTRASPTASPSMRSPPGNL